MTKSLILPQVGDLVMLHNIGRQDYMVLWSVWEMDLLEKESFFPTIIGEMKKKDLGIVLEIVKPKKGRTGAKVYVHGKPSGWVNAKCLKSIEKNP